MAEKTFSVLDFGAVSNSDNQTAAFQKAIDHCFLSGGGEVTAPEGEYVIAGLRLRSNTTLHLLKGAKLIGTRDPEDYLCYRFDTVEPFDDKYPIVDEWVPARQRGVSYEI